MDQTSLEDPTYRAAVVDLLGVLAYGELTAFIRMAVRRNDIQREAPSTNAAVSTIRSPRSSSSASVRCVSAVFILHH